ncbi:MAG: DNA-directed RNA polymerase subunit beta' [bacterium]
MKDIYKVFDKPKSSMDFKEIKVSLASPETIKEWSFGEIKKPETLNHRTFKPEKDGLFCSKIFGPVKDYECLCGKYKRMKYKGIVCERCGVEVIDSKVRRDRMGHITLATPIAHIWFVKSSPYFIGNILGLKNAHVHSIVYCEGFIAMKSEIPEINRGDFISDEKYEEYIEEYGFDALEVATGAAPLRTLLEEVDLYALESDLEKEKGETGDSSKRAKIQKRINVINKFMRSDERPENMILSVLPVIPPDLRPLVPLDGGRFATSDLNDLYRRVINRNNRLKKLMDLGAPDVIIKNEKRMLQEAVDALFDNTKVHRPIQGSNRRPLKSLSDMLRGKQGRFRQNLLGKRVDYSGRSVISVGPDLKLHQCGIPKVMALEIFRPFIYRVLQERSYVSTIKSAKQMVDNKEDVVWEILEEVVKEQMVLLNRAPTLHRLGIQAFEIVLEDSKAIRLHPLVCTPYNADFDGDQMAVHLPVSINSQIEARVLMMSTNNILSPSSGETVIGPTQDMVLGLYYLTTEKPYGKGEGKFFYSPDDVLAARDAGVVEWQSMVYVRINGKRYRTTPGRVLIREITPEEIDFEIINKRHKKKDWTALINRSYKTAGEKKTVLLADNLKNLGYEFSTVAAYSLGISDVTIPEEKKTIIEEAENKMEEVIEKVNRGELSNREKYNHLVDLWDKVGKTVTKKMMDNLVEKHITHEKWGDVIMPSKNPLYIMANSKARGSEDQIKQLGGMRGLMTKPSGEIIETPIKSNFREGLSPLEYFVSTHGARKGSADTALKTANSGYLTRRLVDVAQDVVVVEEDCGTNIGIDVDALINDSGEIISPLEERIFGRTLLDDVLDPDTDEIVVEAGEILDDENVKKIVDLGVDSVNIRSTLTCRSQYGVCAKCYGLDLARNKMINIGSAVGVIAAQSIGEPGTQLTMRTFHVGGIASHGSEQSEHKSKRDGIVEYRNIKKVKVEKGDKKAVVMNRNGRIVIKDSKSGKELEKYPVRYGMALFVNDNEEIGRGQLLARWDPYNTPIVAETGGIIRYVDIEQGITAKEDLEMGRAKTIIIPSKDTRKSPQLVITDASDETSNEDFQAKKVNRGEAIHHLAANSRLEVRDGQEVYAGQVLAKVPRETRKTKDITGGLPRVEELFEVRKVKQPAVVSEIDGYVSILQGEGTHRKTLIEVKPEVGETRKYQVPRTKHINVHDGDWIQAGEPLTEGNVSAKDILRIRGEQEVANFLVQEVQKVYKLQGIKINDKHIEIIVKQMLRKVKITDGGETELMKGEYIEKERLEEINSRVSVEDKKPAEWETILLGITKASLNTESFLSAASFQETTKVLANAAVERKTDSLRGLKENLIIGKRVPAGTGFPIYNMDNYELDFSEDNESDEDAFSDS